MCLSEGVPYHKLYSNKAPDIKIKSTHISEAHRHSNKHTQAHTTNPMLSSHKFAANIRLSPVRAPITMAKYMNDILMHWFSMAYTQTYTDTHTTADMIGR